MSREELDIYCFDEKDLALVASADLLLRKVIRAACVRPAHLVSVAKVLHVWSRLPRSTTNEMDVTVSVVSPRRRFGEIETYHWLEVHVEGDQLSIGSGGHFYRLSTGGDSFTTMSWSALPGENSDFADYREHLTIVPDVQSFPDSVANLDLAIAGYRFEVTDFDNPLLEDMDEEDEQLESRGDPSDKMPNPVESAWSVQPIDSAEVALANQIIADEVSANEAKFAYGVSDCGVCGASLESRGLFVDGALKGQIEWANICAQCFPGKGAGIGWGSGQLYARQPNGDWRLVAGFNPGKDKSDDEFWSQ